MFKKLFWLFYLMNVMEIYLFSLKKLIKVEWYKFRNNYNVEI